MNLSLFASFGLMAALVLSLVLAAVYLAQEGAGSVQPDKGLASPKDKGLAEAFLALSGIPSTSTTLGANKHMWVAYSPKKIYRGGDARLNVFSDGLPLKGASIYVDGSFLYQTLDDDYPLMGLEGGSHDVVVQLDGYGNASVTIVVDSKTYAESEDLKVGLTDAQRRGKLLAGMAYIRLYEVPACVNCKIMADRIAAIADKNHECLDYERLGYWAHIDELEGEFEPMDALPNIIIEGKNGRAKLTGLVDSSDLKAKIREVSECDLA
ncbi:MAG: hypothetical protein V1875_03050 [Candidatus Altiarchaeota archaeon]